MYNFYVHPLISLKHYTVPILIIGIFNYFGQVPNVMLVHSGAENVTEKCQK